MSNVASLSTHAVRVSVGIRFMDQTAPKSWRGMINIDAINIENDCGCVIGQVYGSYNFVRRANTVITSDVQAIMLGFLAVTDEKTGKADYDGLTKAWKAALSTPAQKVPPARQIEYKQAA